MDRTERCELLAGLADHELAQLADLAHDAALGEITTITPPTIGMIMARVTDGAGGDTFNAGEILVTECLVSIDGHEGWSMLMGSRPNATLAAATIDAAFEAGCRNRDRIEMELVSLAATHEAAASAERQRLAATRVHFETQ